MSSQARYFDVNGYRLAAVEWNAGARQKVIACHGWLDNAASFDVLAPLLVDCHVVALDMPGHGYSDHKSQQASYNIWDDLQDILAVADVMGWPTVNLLGHSRGAIMSMLLASAMPQRVNAVAMLDALLPHPIEMSETASQLAKFLTDKSAVKEKKLPSYLSVEAAVAARCRSANMSEKSARLIVERGLDKREDKYYWRNDPRLLSASAFKMTPEHNSALINALTVPNLLLLAEQGLGSSQPFLELLGTYPKIDFRLLSGSHHFHMEAQACAIADMLEVFFNHHSD